MKKYDYLIVGAGLFGSVCAHELNKAGKSCLVVEKRNEVGGNIYTENIQGINVHKYGAHIFHTSDKTVWDYVNSFAEFNNYINQPIARYKNECYNLPFNMNTFTKLWQDVFTPQDAQNKIEEERLLSYVDEPKNLEEQAINLVGVTIYEKLVKGYTQKQWGRNCTDLPPFIIKRLPVRFTFDNNYFNDRYQGIPIGGYTQIINKMLVGSDICLNCDYLANRVEYDAIAAKIIYTGAIDRLFNYKYGKLEYRTLEFKTRVEKVTNYQGNAVVNYTSEDVPYTRIIEHKHFEFCDRPVTVITEEYPKQWQEGDEPYYPINDEKNNALADKYKNEAKKCGYIVGGRLGDYRYYNMDEVIKKAIALTKSLLQ
jgi:UDP-galactopyranose mutase